MTPTQAPIETSPAFEHIPLDQIRIVSDFNARRQMTDDKLTELTASVTQRGVIQPIIVHRSEADDEASEPFVLVAGHRRLEASRRAKRDTIPTLVYDTLDAATKMQIALVENLQREDLNPIDEARGYQRAMQHANLTQAKLAKLTGTNQTRISERLALLKLPDACQQLIASEQIPPTCARSLAQIAYISPAVADACAKLVVRGDASAAELIEQPHVVIDLLIDEEDADTPFVHRADSYGGIRFRSGLSDEQLEALNRRAQDAELHQFRLAVDDIDAARSYGCLLEFEHQFGAHRFVVDQTWMHDRINQHIDTLLAARTDADKASDGTGDTSATTRGGSDAAASSAGTQEPPSAARAKLRQMQADQAKRQAERAEQDKQRDEAITANRQLGLNLVKKLGTKTLDRDSARLLAGLVLHQNATLPARGIRYTHPEYHTLEHVRQKNHKTRTKFTVADSSEVRELVAEWVLRPKHPDEIIGRLLQVLIAGTFADERAVAQTHRTDWHYPSPYFSEIPGLVAKLAKRLLPEHFHPTAERLLPKPTPTAKTKTDKTTKTKATSTSSTTKKPTAKQARSKSTPRTRAATPKRATRGSRRTTTAGSGATNAN